MFRWFKNKNNKTVEENQTCRNCYYYGRYISKDKLNSDKTVTKGKIKYEWCDKGDFYLTDIESCEMYKRSVNGRRYSPNRIKPPPNTVMRGGSEIVRND